MDQPGRYATAVRTQTCIAQCNADLPLGEGWPHHQLVVRAKEAQPGVLLRPADREEVSSGPEPRKIGRLRIGIEPRVLQR